MGAGLSSGQEHWTEETNGGEFESRLCHLLAVGLNTNYLASLRPQSLICRADLPPPCCRAVSGVGTTEHHSVRALSPGLCLRGLDAPCENLTREALSLSPLPGRNTGHRAVG